MKILRFGEYIGEEANASYAGEWPMNKQEMGITDGDVANNPAYAQSEQKFQQVQEYMKQLLFPILKKKNPNADQHDIEKVSDSFFNLGNNKNQEIKQLVDGCKDTKQCAQDIINKYLKYVKINFNTKDNTNDVEQDAVMSSEGFLYEAKRTHRKSNLEDVESVPGYGVKYHNEIFPGVNVPKRYVGKGKFKFRVLAKEGNKVKPINFGDRTKRIERLSYLTRKYWESIPYYK